MSLEVAAVSGGSVTERWLGPRSTPPHWQQRLEAVVPRNDRLSWLYLRYEPGDPWQPVNRWVIWQIRPVHATRPEFITALKGPSPRSTGHPCWPGYCLCDIKQMAWKDGANPLVDLATWEVFRETGGYGTRWWVIQGENGGHRYRLDKWESKVSRINGGPEDTPAPGDLPYAEFDERVIEKIVPYDNVRAYKHIMDYAHRDPSRLDEIEKEGVEEAQRQLWKWLESQVSRTVDGLTRGEINALRDHARDRTPVGSHIGAPKEDHDKILHDFIHSETADD